MKQKQRSEPANATSWPFSGRGVLLVLSFALLLSVATSLLASTTGGDWLGLFGLHSLFVLWICVSLLVLWWLISVLRLPTSPGALTLLVLAVPAMVLVNSWLVAVLKLSPPDLEISWWLLRNTLLGLITALFLVFYLAVQRQWREQVAAETRMRLDALQARIAPHFLFNTLNTITALIHDNPAQAEQATLDVADLLRTGLKGASSHSLGDELELVKGYLRIESLRLGDRLQIEWQLPDELPMDLAMPALIIQPLVENAILHGIARRSEPGLLLIRAERRRFSRWLFVIENPVPAQAAETGEPSLALENIKQRLALAYEEGADLRIRQSPGRFRVELTLPQT